MATAPITPDRESMAHYVMQEAFKKLWKDKLPLIEILKRVADEGRIVLDKPTRHK